MYKTNSVISNTKYNIIIVYNDTLTALIIIIDYKENCTIQNPLTKYRMLSFNTDIKLYYITH